MNPLFEAEIEHGELISRLRLRGEIDYACLGEVATLLGRLNDEVEILIDIDELDFIDAAALRFFHQVSHGMCNRGRARFTRPNGQVGRLLEWVGLDETLRFDRARSRVSEL